MAGRQDPLRADNGRLHSLIKEYRALVKVKSNWKNIAGWVQRERDGGGTPEMRFFVVKRKKTYRLANCPYSRYYLGAPGGILPPPLAPGFVVLIIEKRRGRNYWIRLNNTIQYFRLPIDAWKIGE